MGPAPPSSPRTRLSRRWHGVDSSSWNGSPLIVGNDIWFTVAAHQMLRTLDDTTGALLWKAGLAEPAYTPPAMLDGRVDEAAFRGLVSAFG